MDHVYASSYAGWIEALGIFNKYEPNATHVLILEHDIIYAGHDILPSDTDRGRLVSLGWIWDDMLECWYKFV